MPISVVWNDVRQIPWEPLNELTMPSASFAFGCGDAAFKKVIDSEIRFCKNPTEVGTDYGVILIHSQALLESPHRQLLGRHGARRAPRAVRRGGAERNKEVWQFTW